MPQDRHGHALLHQWARVPGNSRHTAPAAPPGARFTLA